jgi:hypothetical protein
MIHTKYPAKAGRASGRSAGTDARERQVPVVYGEVKRLLIKSHGVPRDVAEYLVERYHRMIRHDYVYAGHGPTEIALDLIYEFEHSRPLSAAHAGRAAGKRKAHKSASEWAYTEAGHAKYLAAHKKAQHMANEMGVDVGIERNDLFKEFRVFLLPRPENRSGHELRAEVVRPMKAGRAAGKARKYYVVEQVQRGSWEQVGHFTTKLSAESFRTKLSGRTRVLHTWPSHSVAAAHRDGHTAGKKHKPWIQHEGALLGYTTHQPMLTRHKILNRVIAKDGYTTAIRRLIVLTRNHHIHSPARRALATDIHWMRTQKKPKK